MNNPLSYQKIMQFGIEFLDERAQLIKDKPVGGI
jgi:hypothetical protein